MNAKTYGARLADKIRAAIASSQCELTVFDKFILDRGYEFDTEEELHAGYDRLAKCKNNILITQDEFIIEAGKHFNPEILKEVYNVLLSLVNQNKLRAAEVYSYARYGWCLCNPEAIIAYQEGRNKWEINNCCTEITEDRAKIKVNSEWGFEASRIKIIGTPYYDATDYQFIRFDCAHMTWLWKNGSLYQIYA